MKSITFLLVLGGVASAAALDSSSCEKLKSLQPADAVFTTVELVPAGPAAAQGRGAEPAAAPAGRGAQAARPVLPAYCRVAATLKPSPDSDIKMELWLPADNWNGKFQMMGNGGWAGSIQGLNQMPTALREGYATAGTDTGHEGANGMFALGHPEKITDFAWRAVHLTVLQSKALIKAYYGKEPKYSYWNGCSTGGRQALIEVTKFPNDFDGVLAGAPANPHIYLHTAGVARSVALMKHPDGALSQAKVETLHNAVLAQCDALDGLKDGLIADPRKCKFDPDSLLCKANDNDKCLTASQVATVKTVYADVKTSTGEIVWTGFEPGGELQFNQLKTIPTTAAGGGWDSVRILGHQDANYDWRQFNLDSDLALADKSGIDTHVTDLTPYKKHGGKLLLYHGWADPGIAPGNTVNFYNKVLGTMGGGKQDDWMRLFMIPGMLHCGGGNGTDQFNKIAILERWREQNQAPDQILASHVTNGQVDMTRPLCPYPQIAVYKGSGSTNDAANFSCKMQ